MTNLKISAGTIARTACLLLALTNQVLSDRGAAGDGWHHHRHRTHQLVEQQQFHPCSPSGRCRVRPPEAENVLIFV